MAEADSVRELEDLQAVLEGTRSALARMLSGSELEAPDRELLATATLSHLDRVREGFRWSLRASGSAVAELRHLLRAADLIDCVGSPDTHPRARALFPTVGPSLRAWQHARIILALVPRLPAERVTYPPPWPPSYLDVPVPRGAAETEGRIEELERTVWNAALERLSRRREESTLRRVYGYFDTGTWVVSGHLRRFRRPEQ